MLCRLALSLVAALIMVLGLRPALALAEDVDVEVEPEGTPIARRGVEVEAEGNVETSVTVQEQEGNDAEELVFSTQVVKEYPLKLGNTVVTPGNKDNITATGGTQTGTASYDPDTNTLKLTDFNFTTTQNTGINYTGSDDLTIELNGSNSVTASYYAIGATGSIVINGDGTLTATGSKGRSIDCSSGHVTISSGTVTAIGGTVGINASGPVIITGGTVTASATVQMQGCSGIRTGDSVSIGDGLSVKAGKDGEASAKDVDPKTYESSFKDYAWVRISPASQPEPEPTEVPIPSVTAHVQRKGWMAAVTDGKAAGTTGKSLRVEALKIKLPAGVSGGIEYRSHVQKSGWEKSWKADGKVTGTTGKSRRVEAVQIRLTGAAKDAYDVYYRVHVQKVGWMAWAKNGDSAGTQGMRRRVEAVQVVLVKKDASAPAKTYNGVTQQYAKAFVKK